MMFAEVNTTQLPLGSLPAAVVVLLALVSIGATAALHAVRGRLTPQVRGAMIPLQIAVTCLAWWLVLLAIPGCLALWERIRGVSGQRLTYNTDWPLWLWAVIGGLSTEAIVALYRFERQAAPRRVGGTLLGLRMTLLALVMFWLVEPSWFTEWSRSIDRFVAVLIDDSASMSLVDKEATAREKLDLAQVFAIELPDRPANFREPLARLSALQRKFADQLRMLELSASTGSAANATQLDARIAKLKEFAATTDGLGSELDKTITQLSGGKLALDAAASASLAAIPRQFKALHDGPFARLQAISNRSDESAAVLLGTLRDDVRSIVEGLDHAQAALARLPQDLDEAYWRSLSAQKRKEIEERTTVARSEIAGRVLDVKGSDGKPMLTVLREGYVLKFYRFASHPTVLKDYPPAGAPDSHSADDKTVTPEQAQRSSTDLAAALEQVARDVPLDRLSGVLVLSDGRHNVDDPVKAVADKLGAEHVSVSTVIIGSRNVPKDAAVMGLEAPDTVLVGDKLSLKAALKIDGYSGKEMLVRLLRGEKEIDRKTIRVPEDRHRTKVEFSQPTKETGIFDYRVELLEPGGTPLNDLVPANDKASRQVSVSDDRVKLLIVEGKPRWEFRYIRSLFAGPDKNVQLQYVLINPTHIEGAPVTAPVPVSASRPPGSYEGTALPVNELEWMKFDVIMLGDVSPEALGKPAIEALHNFVSKRGGTLIVVAGADFMPHAYAQTKLDELLPVTSTKAEGSLRQPPDLGYRLKLTDEGKEHDLMRQAPVPENEVFWNSLPIMWWRHPKTQAKPGATVLAYAEPAYADPAKDKGTARVKPEDQQRREQENALVCFQKYGAGKVLMLTFDETFRLRYCIGVKNHSRFWGQAIRWGAEDKLPAGTSLVRLGTDRRRYDVGKPVTIKARLVDEKAGAVIRDDVVAKVYRGDKLLHTVAMSPEADNSGRYRGEISSALDTGILRVELGGPGVDELVARSGGQTVQTEFAVSDSRATSELVELTADDAVPLQAAAVTQGRVVSPAEAPALLAKLGPRSDKVMEKSDRVLWDCWPVLLLFLGVGSGEWIFRKKAGLT